MGSLQVSFHLVQTSSYGTAPDQSKVVLQIRAMCRQYRRQKAYNRGALRFCVGARLVFLDVISFHLNFIQ